MKVTVEFEIENLHCFYCPLREQNGWNTCVVQRNKKGEYIEFETYEQQQLNCPLKVVEEE